MLIHAPATCGDAVGTGWYCPASGTWHTAEGYPLDAGDVKHWARLPRGPARPF